MLLQGNNDAMHAVPSPPMFFTVATKSRFIKKYVTFQLYVQIYHDLSNLKVQNDEGEFVIFRDEVLF